MALKDWADKIGRLTEDNARRQFRASIFVKLILVIGGATAAAVAQCVELAHSNGEFSVWTIVGIAASVIVAIGGGYLAFTEPDVSKTLEAARQSIEEARDAQEQMREFDADRARLSKEVRRGLELYNSMDVMRGAIEQSLGLPDLTAAKIVQTCLAAASNSLLVAFDFSMEDTWTIGVFRAHKARESDKAVLRCLRCHARFLVTSLRRANGRRALALPAWPIPWATKSSFPICPHLNSGRCSA
jgi:hypothetical protein